MLEENLQLVDARNVAWHDRAHFFAICATLMRRILVHEARARHARKRGGGLLHVSLEESALYAPAPDANLLSLDDALTALEAFDARKARVVELKFFAGPSLDEAAEVLKGCIPRSSGGRARVAAWRGVNDSAAGFDRW